MIFRLTTSSCSSLCRKSGSSRGAEAAPPVGADLCDAGPREAVAEGEGEGTEAEADSDAAIGSPRCATRFEPSHRPARGFTHQFLRRGYPRLQAWGGAASPEC